MRNLIAVFAAILLVSGILMSAADKGPEKMSFTAKVGNVAFDHAKHSTREKDDCKVCHDKLWPQSAKAPLNYKAGMHVPAETKKISCGACHHTGGTAFSSKGNCTNSKCHVKG
jgi:c(7)-type cytochrome triheme protein